MAGTHEDAILIVELAKLSAMLGLADAGRIIQADDFDPDAVEIDHPAVGAVLGYWEMIGALVKNGLLSRDLVLDWVYVAGLWQRVGPAAIRARDRTGLAILYENFEALAAPQP